MNILLTEETDKNHPIFLTIPDIEDGEVSKITFLVTELWYGYPIKDNICEIEFIESRVKIDPNNRDYLLENLLCLDDPNFVVYFTDESETSCKIFHNWNEESRVLNLNW